MSTQRVRVTIFSILVVNFARFRISRSYTLLLYSHPFLSALGTYIILTNAIGGEIILVLWWHAYSNINRVTEVKFGWIKCGWM